MHIDNFTKAIFCKITNILAADFKANTPEFKKSDTMK